MHDRSCSAASKALLIDVALAVGAQWNGVRIRGEAIVLLTQQPVTLVKCLH